MVNTKIGLIMFFVAKDGEALHSQQKQYRSKLWFRGTRYQIANICWIIEKARELHKNIYFCFIDYAKAFDCVDHHKL